MTDTGFKSYHIVELRGVRDRLDAISAAVKGADMNDCGEQAGIAAIIHDVWLTVQEMIKEVEGNREAESDGE